LAGSLWLIIEPMLLPMPPKSKGLRAPVPGRAALTSILFVLRMGIPREMLPAEIVCGSRVTCWRLLRDWQVAGMWDRLHRELLRQLRDADRTDWSGLECSLICLRALAGRFCKAFLIGGRAKGNISTANRSGASLRLDI
jgi:transposase